MIRAANLLLLAAPMLAAAAVPIGIYQGWGAFRDAGRCYATARSLAPGGRGGGQASIGTWPRRGLRSSLSIRLSRERDRSAPVTLTVGERHFPLVADGTHAFAPDGPSDRALVSAIRQGRSMSVEAVGEGGRPFADVYALAGAATAIDAAALACVAMR